MGGKMTSVAAITQTPHAFASAAVAIERSNKMDRLMFASQIEVGPLFAGIIGYFERVAEEVGSIWRERADENFLVALRHHVEGPTLVEPLPAHGEVIPRVDGAEATPIRALLDHPVTVLPNRCVTPPDELFPVRAPSLPVMAQRDTDCQHDGDGDQRERGWIGVPE